MNPHGGRGASYALCMPSTCIDHRRPECPRRAAGIIVILPHAAPPVASRKNPHRPIADWAASEMSLEVNILHHLANCIETRGGLAPGNVTNDVAHAER